MKITEYIAALEAIKAEHGDLEVEKSRLDCERGLAAEPTVDYRAILKGREHKPRFASSFYREEDRKGEKVCRIA